MENSCFKTFFFVCILVCSYVMAQHCAYILSANSNNLTETGKFNLKITNTDKEAFKINKEINFCNMRLTKLELFNNETHTFANSNLGIADVDCFTYKDKKIKLKPGKSYEYKVDIKSDFSVWRIKEFFENFKNDKYRFKISFTIDSYSKCGKSAFVETDWIYKN